MSIGLFMETPRQLEEVGEREVVGGRCGCGREGGGCGREGGGCGREGGGCGWEKCA